MNSFTTLEILKIGNTNIDSDTLLKISNLKHLVHLDLTGCKNIENLSAGILYFY